MFEKVITNALISPGLHGKLSMYARQRRRTVQRRFILVILSFLFLLTQCVGLAAKPQMSEGIKGSVDASGINSSRELITRYDENQSAIKDLANLLSISREDLEHTQEKSLQSIPAHKLVIEWSLSPTFLSSLSSSDHVTPSFILKGHNDRIYYGHLINLKSKKNVDLLYGMSRQTGNFAVIKNTANFLSSYDTASNADICRNKNPKYFSLCSGNNKIHHFIAITNRAYKSEASFIKTRPGDQLIYTVYIENITSETLQISPQLYLGDILEYAHVSKSNKAIYKHNTQNLSWPTTSVLPHQKIAYSFNVHIFDSIPLVAQNTNNISSYDCTIATFFGSTYSLPIACPAQKVMERFMHIPFNPLLTFLAAAFFCINLLIYLRSRLLCKELDIILSKLQRK